MKVQKYDVLTLHKYNFPHTNSCEAPTSSIKRAYKTDLFNVYGGPSTKSIAADITMQILQIVSKMNGNVLLRNLMG